MFKGLANFFRGAGPAVGGAIATTSFTNPAVNGINYIPAEASFGNFLNSFVAGVNNSPVGYLPSLGQLPQNYTGGPQAIDAYRNIQGQFIGYPPQYIENNNSRRRAQALAPGPAVIGPNSTYSPTYASGPINPQALSQAVFPNSSSPLVGQAGVINGATPYVGPGSFGVAPYGPAVQSPFLVGPTGGLGIINSLQFLIMPIVGLFGLVKSLFSFTRIAKSLKPVEVNENDLAYNNVLNSIEQYQHEEGSFEEYYPQEELNDFDISKL